MKTVNTAVEALTEVVAQADAVYADERNDIQDRRAIRRFSDRFRAGDEDCRVIAAPQPSVCAPTSDEDDFGPAEAWEDYLDEVPDAADRYPQGALAFGFWAALKGETAHSAASTIEPVAWQFRDEKTPKWKDISKALYDVIVDGIAKGRMLDAEVRALGVCVAPTTSPEPATSKESLQVQSPEPTPFVCPKCGTRGTTDGNASTVHEAVSPESTNWNPGLVELRDFLRDEANKTDTCYTDQAAYIADRIDGIISASPEPDAVRDYQVMGFDPSPYYGDLDQKISRDELDAFVWRSLNAYTALATTAAALSAPVAGADGVVVPREITLEMQKAYFDVIDRNMERVQNDLRFGRFDSNKQAYRAMLAAVVSRKERGGPQS